MKKIAIVGNIASGKSQIEKILLEKGYKTICADKISHEIFDFDENIRKEIYNFFNTNNREDIANIVFSDSSKKEILEKIMHPQIKKKILDFFNRNKEEEFTFAIVPLLFEANMSDMFDYIILICADENIRIKRLIERNGFDKKHALLRIRSQKPQEEKIPHADFIIDNNGSIDNLKTQIESILKKLEQH